MKPTVSIRIREEEIFHYLFAVNEQQYTTIETLVSIRKIKRKGILTGVVAGSDVHYLLGVFVCQMNFEEEEHRPVYWFIEEELLLFVIIGLLKKKERT